MERIVWKETVMDEQLKEVFQRQEGENRKFWNRFGGMPDVRGKTVLDIGSGLGNMCIDMAREGADRVVGLDIKPALVKFSQENLVQSYPDEADRIEFQCMELQKYDSDALFDCIISKNSFEHIADPEAMLGEMKRRLAPGGRIHIGFGPLYRSLNGPHMQRFFLPWGHLILPQWLFLKICSWDRRHPMRSMDDFHLNFLPFREFERIFKSSGLRIVSFRTNQGTSSLVRLMGVLRKLPFLREICTTNIYCILELKK